MEEREDEDAAATDGAADADAKANRRISPTKAVEQAMRALAANRLDEADALCQGVLKARPHHGGALHAMGLVHLKRRRLPQAVEAFQNAVGRSPDNPQYHANLGEALRRSGRFEDALESFRQAYVLHPEFLTAHLGMANALRDLGRLPEAMAQLRVAVAIDHRFAEGHHYLGLALKEKGDQPGALAVLRKAVALKRNYTEAEMSLGNLLEDLGKWEEAIVVFRQLLSHEPNHPGALNNLGNIYRVLGRMEEAAEFYRKIIERDPNHAQARYNLSRTGRAGDDGPRDVAEILSLLETPGLSEGERVSLHFSLGKIYDDMGEYEKAFHHFTEGNTLDHRPPEYDAAGHDQLIDRLIAVCDADFFAHHRGIGSQSERPLLIVGMPRSGTTLVEQILASHPEVYGGGERSALPDAVNRLGTMLKLPQTYPEGLNQLDTISACRLADLYESELPAAAGARRITDKLPANFHHVGLFALLFPNARVIHCRRDPMDTCLSCYFQHFTQVMPFSRDQKMLAHYYRAYTRIMDHWRGLKPLPILDVDYEKVVADQEGETRRLLDFCGLEWSDACLRFFETERAVKTASVWQVRQPMYASSVGRWKHYASFLEPLGAALAEKPGERGPAPSKS